MIDYTSFNDGKTLCTEFLQQAIDATPAGGKLTVPAGTYLTGSLFLHSEMIFELAEGATLLAVTDNAAFKRLPSRVAGVEMVWPSAILNARDAHSITITGGGLIDGQGWYWWNQFWGPDRKGGLKAVYEPMGLRWATDYDCERPRSVLIYNCENVTISGLNITQSPFWNIHLCYSKHVLVENVHIDKCNGPSTDGVDVDSCDGVVVRYCDIHCNDDSICLKSGRDADGLRVNRVCQNVEVHHCDLGVGEGITLGSETSGGIRQVYIHDCKFRNTNFGFRIKSARNRGGVIEDIRVENLEMTDVATPFGFNLNWFPAYSYCEIPKDYTGPIPDYWYVMCERVPEEKGIPTVRNMEIRHVRASLSSQYRQGIDMDDHKGMSCAFLIKAFPERPMENVLMEDVHVTAREYGTVANIRNWMMKDVTVDIIE